jgi:hypothetical protein
MKMDHNSENERLRAELSVLRAENALLRQAVEQLKTRLADLIVQAHRLEMPRDAPAASDLKGKKAIYWG